MGGQRVGGQKWVDRKWAKRGEVRAKRNAHKLAFSPEPSMVVVVASDWSPASEADTQRKEVANREM